MGLLDGTTQRNYYSNAPNGYGDYQFTSLDDAISYFTVAYVGEGKIIPKIKRADVAFHAMRALQELSFDTFKSVKAQEIVLPPSLKMILPQDYVNYTQVSWSDDSGIKRPLYPTKHTSNPFSILQDVDGSYEFSNDVELLFGNSFSSASGTIHPRWKRSSLNRVQRNGQITAPTGYLGFGGGYKIQSNNTNEALEFTHVSQPINPINNLAHTGRILSCWQKLDVTGVNSLKISAVVNVNDSSSNPSSPDGEVTIGLQTQPGQQNTTTDGNPQQLSNSNYLSKNIQNPNLGFMLFNSSAGSDVAQEQDVDVSGHDTVYFIINSRVKITSAENDGTGVIENGTGNGVIPGQITFKNIIKEVSAVNGLSTSELLNRDLQTENSTTFENFRSNNPSENTNNNYNYDTDNFDLNRGQRFGLDPQHAQVNGSFYIDNLQGFINFSSNVSGKTVILDYISDSLGTDGEMQVHKFAEDALYKSMICDIMSTRLGVPEYAINRYKKDKKASRRTAKLRLSNIKLEELTQILRGKSKQIKH